MSEFLGFVYLLKCNLNGKIYVGITSDVLSKRWNKHVYDARHDSKCVIHRAMRKYGLDNFSMSEIKQCHSEQELLSQEKFFIEELKSNVKYGGYNETFGGEAPMLGRHHSDASKLKISEKLKGRPSPNRGKKASEETRRKLGESHSKPVVRLDINDKLIAVHKSVTAASLATGVAGSNISGVCRNKKKSAGGFHWQYMEN